MLRLKSINCVKFLPVIFGGMLISLLSFKIMSLEFRFTVACVGGIVFISLLMMGISYVTDILILATVFNIPFSMFGKVLFKSDISWAVMPGISIGLAEVIILSAYTVWFCQVFIARSKPLPKLRGVDCFIILLLLGQLVSTIGTRDKQLAIFDIIYNFKYILMYLFIAHNVKRYHVKWIITIILFAIVLESTIALYERNSGNVGIGRAKGRSASRVDSAIGIQTKVPGIIEQIRAEGTTAEPHILGEYFAMILPLPFVLIMTPGLRMRWRFVVLVVLVMGVGGLVVTFSRSGWLSFAIATVFALGVIVFLWKQWKALVISGLICVVVSLSYPKVYEYLFIRVFKAPKELLTSRFDMNRTALSIWQSNFFFGYGPGNYMHALEDPDVTVYEFMDRSHVFYPVHNMFLYIASEYGLCGVIAFFGTIFTSIIYCWKMIRCNDLLMRALALAIMTGLIAYLLDGVTNCLSRQTVPYAQLWVYLGLAMSFKRILSEGTSAGPTLEERQVVNTSVGLGR